MRALLLLPGLVLCSCSTVRFYSQALGGQAEILQKARPVAEVLADPKSKPLLKQKLNTVADIRAYAETAVHLPAKGQYERYANLGRRHVVWVVFAAPEFSVEARKWWYPLVGSLSYRGFFKERLAEQEAAGLRAEGLDVYVGGVDAYSTLGFLRDPLLNTFIGRSDAELAELIFHELTHQRLYLSGDTDFNEAFASAVGQEGARRWLRAQGRTRELAQYEKEMRIEREFVALVLRTREELKQVYSRTYRSVEIERAAKAAAFVHMRQRADALDRRYGGSLKIERWFQKPVNNARLSTLATYYEMLPGFEALLKAHGGDLESFFKAVEAMRGLGKEARRQKILSLTRA